MFYTLNTKITDTEIDRAFFAIVLKKTFALFFLKQNLKPTPINPIYHKNEIGKSSQKICLSQKGYHMF